MNAFATHPAFSQPASQPVLRFLGSPEQLLVACQQSGGEFALFQTTAGRGHGAAPPSPAGLGDLYRAERRVAHRDR
jgi:hypothetical protein